MSLSQARSRGEVSVPPRVFCLFGTRPELIKVAPVIRALAEEGVETVVINSGQHRDLVRPLMQFFGVRCDYELDVMREGQSLNGLCSRVLQAIDPVIGETSPTLVLVQGDTTTAFAGAMAAFHRGVPVGHIEAGLRSGHALSPWPEEMNRRLISRIAAIHFAATERNRAALLTEGVDPSSVFLTGNPVLSALHETILLHRPTGSLAEILEISSGLRRIVLTSHRRENFGKAMEDQLRTIHRFITDHSDAALVFPVHPNPRVRATVDAVMPPHERIFLVEPMSYPDFVHLLAEAELIVSDSGGIQEEAPSLRKPLLVLRENTERPEAIEAGVSRLVGTDSARLRGEMEAVWRGAQWAEEVRRGARGNPFGDHRAARLIATETARYLESVALVG